MCLYLLLVIVVEFLKLITVIIFYKGIHYVFIDVSLLVC